MSENKVAIISVFDKSGLDRLANKLADKGYNIFSTGGTLKKLKELDIPASSVSSLTGFPEIMNGRVKTLHPGVLGGILCDRSKHEQIKDIENNNLRLIDVVVVNLYPFEQSLEEGRSHRELIEMIDIGGPTMVRAAAKNYESVVVLTSPAQYDEFIDRLDRGSVDLDYREQLARDAFVRIAEYDITIAGYFQNKSKEELRRNLLVSFKREDILRYGENPHQKAAFYLPSGLNEPIFHQLHGKQLSFNNYGDLLSAYEMVKSWDRGIAVSIIKHANPCGFGIGENALEAYQRAVATDPVSYFGGIVACNTRIEAEFAEILSKPFLECIIAPSFSEDALRILKKKKNLRLILPGEKILDYNYHLHSLGPGMLLQTVDKSDDYYQKWELVSDNSAGKDQIAALELGWHVVKYVKSNAIVIANPVQTVGVGAGQMSRVDSLKIAIRKAKEAGLNLKGSVIASDAFFPFRDSIDVAGNEGISSIVEPGGSIRDNEVIEAANEYGIALYFSRTRHFRHY